VKLLRVVGLLVALLIAGAVARAETQSGSGAIDLMGATGAGRNVLAPTGAPPVAPMSRPVDPNEYVVGPGDMLQLNLSGGVNRSWEAMILPEGTLYVPSIGPIQLTGMTLANARHVVQQRLSVEYRGVAVDLRLLHPRTFLVYLIGETSAPGPHEVYATSRASELLTEPLFTEAASRRNVEIRRRTPQREIRTRMDMTRFRLTGYLANDPLLLEGDQVFFPRVSADVTIGGAVARPSKLDLAPGDSLSTLLALAGGPLTSATDRAVLVRFVDATLKDSLSFNVGDVLAGRFDTLLRDGDHVYLYFQPRFHFLEQASIFGEVQRPGIYPILPGPTRLSDLVKLAGGFLPDADQGSIRVVRSVGPSGQADPEITRLSQLGRRDMTASEYEVLRARVASQRQDFRVDWKKVKVGGDLDIVLRGGDAVSVDQVVATVRVDGEVRLPGLISYEPGRSVEEYVKLAGGYSERALPHKVRVKRAVTGQTILARDVSALQPGDMIWVPERGDPQAWQNFQAVLLVATQVATIILALRVVPR
jgi:protein involved in polysaccharide export with SLBB domain